MSSALPLPCMQDFIRTGPECQLGEENMDKVLGPFKCVKEYSKDLQRQEYGLTPPVRSERGQEKSYQWFLMYSVYAHCNMRLQRSKRALQYLK